MGTLASTGRFRLLHCKSVPDWQDCRCLNKVGCVFVDQAHDAVASTIHALVPCACVSWRMRAAMGA
eukprot:4409412-Amphidinium_carterae.1